MQSVRKSFSIGKTFRSLLAQSDSRRRVARGNVHLCNGVYKIERETWEMKRTTLISASLLLAFAGCTCGQGWRPNFMKGFSSCLRGNSNVGEPCDAGCRDAAMSAPMSAGCETCGTANYGGYEQVGQVVEGQPGVQYSSAPQSYAPQSYPTGPSTVTREPISARKN